MNFSDRKAINEFTDKRFYTVSEFFWETSINHDFKLYNCKSLLFLIYCIILHSCLLTMFSLLSVYCALIFLDKHVSLLVIILLEFKWAVLENMILMSDYWVFEF